MKYLYLLIAMLLSVEFSIAQVTDIKIWKKILIFETTDNLGEIEKRREKYGFRSLTPGIAFYESYTSTALCAYSDESSKSIESLVYYGGQPVNSIGVTSFYSHLLNFGDRKYYLWICTSPVDGKLIVAVTEPQNRTLTVEKFDKISGNEVRDSIAPISDKKSDSKYIGDKILGQIVIESARSGNSDIKTVISIAEKTAKFDIILDDKITYNFAFDSEKKVLVKVVDHK